MRVRQKDVAVKVLLRKFDAKALEAFRREVCINCQVSHPNVVLFMYVTSLFGSVH